MGQNRSTLQPIEDSSVSEMGALTLEGRARLLTLIKTCKLQNSE